MGDAVVQLHERLTVPEWWRRNRAVAWVQKGKVATQGSERRWVRVLERCTTVKFATTYSSNDLSELEGSTLTDEHHTRTRIISPENELKRREKKTFFYDLLMKQYTYLNPYSTLTAFFVLLAIGSLCMTGRIVCRHR